MKRTVMIAFAAAMLLSGCGESSFAEPEAVPAIVQTPETIVPAVTTVTASPPALTAAEIAGMPAESRVTHEEIASLDIDTLFTAEPVSDAVFARINGVSYQENPYISRDDLRYLRVLHFDPAGDICTGELICNQAIADDLLEIFTELYKAEYPIGSMQLIDDFDGDDNASMAANNTSCFNYRVIAGSSVLSYHAQGLAIDINPQFNPYVTAAADGSEHIEPENGQRYADRSIFFPMKIESGDLCCRLFAEHGFDWGGDWDSPKDYQHFEKPLK